MDGWLLAVVTAGLVLLIALGLLAGLAVRRRLLAQGGGTFECSARLRTDTPGAGWALGLARYSGDTLEWYRFFSYSLGPRRRLVRGAVRVVETREPDSVEAVALYAGQQVLVLADTDGSEPAQTELAMGPESLTGLLSWLEAAPPGGAGRG